jgi:hypothetical protein
MVIPMVLELKIMVLTFKIMILISALQQFATISKKADVIAAVSVITQHCQKIQVDALHTRRYEDSPKADFIIKSLPLNSIIVLS